MPRLQKSVILSLPSVLPVWVLWLPTTPGSLVLREEGIASSGKWQTGPTTPAEDQQVRTGKHQRDRSFPRLVCRNASPQPALPSHLEKQRRKRSKTTKTKAGLAEGSKWRCWHSYDTLQVCIRSLEPVGLILT